MRLDRFCFVVVGSLVWCTSCAQGGDEDRPSSEVKIEANHHMFGLIGRHEFSEFPIKIAEVATDRGTLIMKEDSTYQVQRTGQNTAPAETYALAKTGAFDIFVSQGARRPLIRFLGAYGLGGATNHYYFTDRFLATATSSVGLFFGVRVVTGTANLEGDWHLLSLHAIFSGSQVLNPANVGRAAVGSIAIDAAGKLTGTGLESTKAALTFSGEARPFDDGRVDLAITFADPQTADERLVVAGASPLMVVGVDEVEQTERDAGVGEAGLVVLLRKRVGAADPNLLAGTFNVGGHTVFVNPTNSGFDAAAGTLTFTASGAFRLEAKGSGGVSFTYSGTYTLTDDGTLALEVDGTDETWAGAVDQNYHTVFLVDNFVEDRQGTSKPPELNLFMGVRPVPE